VNKSSIILLLVLPGLMLSCSKSGKNSSKKAGVAASVTGADSAANAGNNLSTGDAGGIFNPIGNEIQEPVGGSVVVKDPANPDVELKLKDVSSIVESNVEKYFNCKEFLQVTANVETIPADFSAMIGSATLIFKDAQSRKVLYEFSPLDRMGSSYNFANFDKVEGGFAPGEYDAVFKYQILDKAYEQSVFMGENLSNEGCENIKAANEEKLEEMFADVGELLSKAPVVQAPQMPGNLSVGGNAGSTGGTGGGTVITPVVINTPQCARNEYILKGTEVYSSSNYKVSALGENKFIIKEMINPATDKCLKPVLCQVDQFNVSSSRLTLPSSKEEFVLFYGSAINTAPENLCVAHSLAMYQYENAGNFFDFIGKEASLTEMSLSLDNSVKWHFKFKAILSDLSEKVPLGVLGAINVKEKAVVATTPNLGGVVNNGNVAVANNSIFNAIPKLGGTIVANLSVPERIKKLFTILRLDKCLQGVAGCYASSISTNQSLHIEQFHRDPAMYSNTNVFMTSIEELNKNYTFSPIGQEETVLFDARKFQQEVDALPIGGGIFKQKQISLVGLLPNRIIHAVMDTSYDSSVNKMVKISDPIDLISYKKGLYQNIFNSINDVIFLDGDHCKIEIAGANKCKKFVIQTKSDVINSEFSGAGHNHFVFDLGRSYVENPVMSYKISLSREKFDREEFTIYRKVTQIKKINMGLLVRALSVLPPNIDFDHRKDSLFPMIFDKGIRDAIDNKIQSLAPVGLAGNGIKMGKTKFYRYPESLIPRQSLITNAVGGTTGIQPEVIFSKAFNEQIPNTTIAREKVERKANTNYYALLYSSPTGVAHDKDGDVKIDAKTWPDIYNKLRADDPSVGTNSNLFLKVRSYSPTDFEMIFNEAKNLYSY
jgi:hypothetical protein